MENISVKEIVYKVYFLDKQYNFLFKKCIFHNTDESTEVPS